MPKNSDKHVSGEQYLNLIDKIKTSLDTHLREKISKMFIDADELLFEMSDKASSNEDQNRLFELMRNLRVQKNEISTDFLNNIKPYLRPFAETESEKKQQKRDSEGELSLIGQEEMEDMVLIKSMSGSAAGWFREAISHLEARLEHLALKTPEIFAKDALSPLNICQAFDDALSGSFNIDNRKILFRMFNDNVLSRLDTVYSAINNLLIEAGILPQIKLHAKKSAQKKPSAQQPEEEQIYPDESEDEPPINQGGYAMTARPGHTHHGAIGQSSMGGQAGGRYSGSAGSATGGQPAGGGYTNHGTGAQGSESGSGYTGDGGAAGSYSHAAGGGAGGGAESGGGGPGSTSSGGNTDTGQSTGVTTDGSTGEAGGNAGSGFTSGAAGQNGQAGVEEASASTGQPASYQHQTAGMPASDVSKSIGDFLGSPIAPRSAPGESGPSFPASTSQYYGHQEILDALSGIQLKPEFNEANELIFDADAIKRSVLAQISSSSGGLVTKRINRIAEKTIDFIELIFDAIIEDTDISDTIKALLLRLQIPVIKASMIDQEFFIYDNHPARVLLDRITEVGIGVTDHSDEIYIFLNGIINTLVSEFELQTSSFQNALDELNEYIEERDALALEKEEESQRQVLREHARNTVLKALRNITRGKTLPEPIHPLVLKRWPTLMFNHYLNHGKENNEWITILEALRDIIESAQPLTSASQLHSLISNRENLIETTLSYLNRTNQSKKDIEKVIQGLNDVHQLHIDNASFTQHEKAHAAEEAIIEKSKPVETKPLPVEEEKPAPRLPSNIMPGMWFQVYMGEEHIPRRCKLSVIIIQDSKLVFVNYQGDIIAEKNIEEFSDELDDGRSRLIMGHSVFDHALNRVISKLHTEH